MNTNRVCHGSTNSHLKFGGDWFGYGAILGLARGKKLRRLFSQNGWSEEDHAMAAYLCDDVSPYMVHVDMFITTIEEQGNDEQRNYWLPRVNAWEVIGCYAQ